MPSGDHKWPRDLAVESTAVITYLDALKNNKPPALATPAAYRAAIDYAIERYREGLKRYVDAFAGLGASPGQRGLDIGCGAGHWCHAFLDIGDEVVGVDLRSEYVAVAASVARTFDHADRACFATAKAERLPFQSASFDFAWSHGVFMFVDTEDALCEVARVLVEGGVFYCAYSLAGTRVLQLTRALSAGTAVLFQRHLTIILEAALRRCGIYHTVGSRVQMMEVDELVAACGAAGLELVRRPGVQDLNIRYLGFDATCDLLVRKSVTGEQRINLDELLAAGYPKRVADILATQVGSSALAAEQRSLYARALILSGRASDRTTMHLLDDPLLAGDAALHGIYALDRRRPNDAARAFGSLDPSHPDRAFLLAMSYMRKNEYRSAADIFRHAISVENGALRNWAGLAAALFAAGDRSGSVASFMEFVRSRSDAGVPSSEVEEVLTKINEAPSLA